MKNVKLREPLIWGIAGVLLILPCMVFADNADAAELVELGLEHVQQGNFLDAILYMNQAVDLNTVDPEAFYARGFSYYSLENYDQALTDYSRAA